MTKPMQCPLCRQAIDEKNTSIIGKWRLLIGALTISVLLAGYFDVYKIGWQARAEEYARKAATSEYKWKKEIKENKKLRDQLNPDPGILLELYPDEEYDPGEEQEDRDNRQDEEEDFVEKFLESEGF